MPTYPKCAEDTCRREDRFCDLHDHKCIFHTDKTGWYVLRSNGSKDWSSHTAEINGFWKELKEQKIDKNDYYCPLFVFPLFPLSNPFTHTNALRIKTELRFTGAQFLSWARFSSMWLEEGAFFDGAVFNEAAEFSHVEFLKHASFSETSFLGGVTFTGIFHEEAQFRNVRFSSDHPSRFNPYYPSKQYDMFKGATYFTGINFPRSVAFRHVDLSNVSFSGSNLEEVTLLECSFDRVQGRYELFDERRVFASSGGEVPRAYFGVLEDMYRQLKFNFENRNDWQNAAEFYVSQMEIRRLRLRIEANDLKIRKEEWSKANAFPPAKTTTLERLRERLPKVYTRRWWRKSLERFFLAGFSIISRYGEQPDRAFLWILAALGTGTVGIFLSQHSGWKAALLTTVRAVTFQQENGFDLLEHNTQWIVTLLRIASAILLPLFLLALRRRFKR